MAPVFSSSPRRRAPGATLPLLLAACAAWHCSAPSRCLSGVSVPPAGAAAAAPTLRREALLAGLTLWAASPAGGSAAPLGKVVVLGGSGFVGSRICEKLVGDGAEVTSISRSGGPPSGAGAWAQKVTWLQGDVRTMDLSAPLAGSDAVVSAIGAIGSEDDEGLNGATAEVATVAAAAAKAKRFVLVSATPLVAEAGAGNFVPGYVKGKQRAEAAVAAFPGGTAVLQPTFVFGGTEFSATPPRVASWYGQQIEALLGSPLVRPIAAISPAPVKLALLPPNSVEDVAAAAVAGATGKVSGVLAGHDAIAAAAAA